MEEENFESLLGIKLFEWESWDELVNDWFQFYNVKFYLNSLKQYDDKTVAMNREGEIEIYDDKDEVIKIDLLKVPEFVEKIKEKIQ